jgi:hypothetical protein
MLLILMAINQIFRHDYRGCDVAAPSGKPSGKEHGIGALRVERSPGAVAEAAGGDFLAAYELARAQVGKLLLPIGGRLLRLAGQGGQRKNEGEDELAV